MMLLNLPPELLVSILKYLPLSDISACICTCKLLKHLIDQHESTVYRQAAAHPSQNLIPHDHVLFSEIVPLGLLSKRYLGDAGDWKGLCRRACEVRSSWLGKGASHIKNYYSEYARYPSVHRIKVDERRGFFITTHGLHNFGGQGRLQVSEMRDGRAIWALDPRHVRQHAHCEYGEGFLIFDRSMAKEVWRLVSKCPEIPDPEEFEVVPESKPDENQLSARQIISQDRLKFVPHAFLRPPSGVPTRAFRFVYPTLLVAGSNCLLLWDVRTGKLVERMNGIATQMPHLPNAQPASASPWQGHHNSNHLGQICYVEVNDKYAVVCGDNIFKVFQRSTQTSGTNASKDSNEATANCVLAITQAQLRRRGRWVVRLGYVQAEDLPEGFEDLRTRRDAALQNVVDASEDDDPTSEGGLINVDSEVDQPGDDGMEDGDGGSEIGESGSDEGDIPGALVRPTPRISMWKNSGKAVVSHKTELTDSSLSITLEDEYSECCVAAHVSPCGKHLAILADMARLLIIPYFERVIDGRVKDYHDIMIDLQLGPLQSIYLAYEEGRIGVVTQVGVFIIHPAFPSPGDSETRPQLHVQRIPLLNDPRSLFYVSCLQMTSTAIWMNWEVEPNNSGGPFSSNPLALESLEMNEEYLERGLAGDEYLPAMRLSLSSVVVSVDFGLGSET